MASGAAVGIARARGGAQPMLCALGDWCLPWGVVLNPPTRRPPCGMQVSKTDTLAGLAIKYNVSVAAIRRANGLAGEAAMFARGVVHVPARGAAAAAAASPPAPPAGGLAPRKAAESLAVHSGSGDARAGARAASPSSVRRRICAGSFDAAASSAGGGALLGSCGGAPSEWPAQGLIGACPAHAGSSRSSSLGSGSFGGGGGGGAASGLSTPRAGSLLSGAPRPPGSPAAQRGAHDGGSPSLWQRLARAAVPQHAPAGARRCQPTLSGDWMGGAADESAWGGGGDEEEPPLRALLARKRGCAKAD